MVVCILTLLYFTFILFQYFIYVFTYLLYFIFYINILVFYFYNITLCQDGMTPLIAATLENDTDLVNMLLKKGADANQKDGFQRSAIHCAAQWGNNAIVANLLKQGTNVDIEDRSWKTPLYYATEYDFPECVQLLLSARADPLHKCKDESPLDVAMKKKLSTVAKMMKDALEG
jgi:ankyrin repeat protein